MTERMIYDIISPDRTEIVGRVPLPQFSEEVHGWRNTGKKPKKGSYVLLDDAGNIWRPEECRTIAAFPKVRTQ